MLNMMVEQFIICMVISHLIMAVSLTIPPIMEEHYLSTIPQASS